MKIVVFESMYEYQGNAPKLAHTEITDKCYDTKTGLAPRVKINK